MKQQPMEVALAKKMMGKQLPDITVGSAPGRYRVQDKGSAAANLQAIRKKAQTRGYPNRVIEKRWPQNGA